MKYIEVFDGFGVQIFISCIAILIVFIAMIIDLCSGLHKAKINGSIIASFGLKRSASKFIIYIGGMLIAFGVDVIMHIGCFWSIIHLSAMSKVPVISCLLAIFLCVVEFRSVWEKAGVKQKRGALETAEMLLKVVDKEVLIKSISESLSKAGKADGKND